MGAGATPAGWYPDAERPGGERPPSAVEPGIDVGGQSEGKGVVVVNGRLVENLHVEEARRNLALGDAIARMGA